MVDLVMRMMMMMMEVRYVPLFDIRSGGNEPALPSRVINQIH